MFIAVAVFSAVIELIQYIGYVGLAELDDVICNTLGALLGYGAMKCVKRIWQDAT